MKITRREWMRTAVIGIHRSFHTVEETLERTDARLLVPVLRAHQRTIELLVKPGIG
jgi:hypothetical protein